MKKILKDRIFQFIITAIIFTEIGVLATNSINATEVTYKGETLDKTLDTLYQRSTYTEYSGLTTVTPTTTEQILSTNNKLLKSDITIGAIPSSYKNLSTTTTVTANKLLSGETAYDNLGNLITGNGLECMEASTKFTEASTMATGQELVSFWPSHWAIFITHPTYDYTVLFYYNSELNPNYLYRYASGSNSATTTPTYSDNYSLDKYKVNNKLSINSLSNQWIGGDIYYIACR